MHMLLTFHLLLLLSLYPHCNHHLPHSINEPKTELYLMMELMDCDLHKVIQSKQVQ